MDSIQEKALKMALSSIVCTSQKIVHFKSSRSFNVWILTVFSLPQS
jgi:hypothetical protein